MSKKITKEKGITLIALVITIIVMLILVAVTINLAINGGLFDYAKTAKEKTLSQVQGEQELATLESNLTTEDLVAKYTTNKVEDLAKLKLYFEGRITKISDLAVYANNEIISDASTSITRIGQQPYISVIQYHNNKYAVRYKLVDANGNDVETDGKPDGAKYKFTVVEALTDEEAAEYLY